MNLVMPSPGNVLILSEPGPHLAELASLNGVAQLTITDNAGPAVEAAPCAAEILNGFFNGRLRLLKGEPLENIVDKQSGY